MPLKTPDPAFTSESLLALLATVVPMLVVLFKLNVTAEVQASAITAAGAVFTAFSLWHAARVRAARAAAGVVSNDPAPPTAPSA